MIKDFINYLASPEISFTLTILLFFLAISKIEVFASKKFAYPALVVLLIGFAWAITDPVLASTIIFADNIATMVLIPLVIWSTWFAIHKAVENDKRIAEGLEPMEGTPENREKVWAWPNLVYTELFAIIACTVFLIIWAILFKAPLEEPANPTWAPNPAKAPWYFLGLQEMLVYFDPWIAGVVLPGIIVVGLIAIPFIDMNPKGNGYYTFKERKFAITSFIFGWLVLWIFLIILGTFFRGPNWTFYGPFEYWDHHKLVAESNINLSEIFWIKLFNTGLPDSIFLREISGILVVLGYFVVGGLLFTKLKGKAYLEKMGMIRYSILVFLVLMTLSLPIKMYLRWIFNLKYILAMPEFELNI